MAILPEIKASSMFGDDPQAQIQSLAKQVNQWGKSISNETRTDVYKDNTGTPRILIGVLPDGTTGIVVSKEGTDVLSTFD